MTMKKLLAVLVAICLLAAGVVAYSSSLPHSAVVAESETASAAADAVTPAETENAAAADVGEEESGLRYLDYDALYALHDPTEPVIEINGKDETWGDYFYVLYSQCGQIENYFEMMLMYYGYQSDWMDPIDEEGTTYEDAALENAELILVQTAAIEGYAEKNGITLDEEDEAAIEEQKQADYVSALGDGATEEDFAEYIQSIYLSKDLYDRITKQNYLYQKMFKEIYGENGEKVAEEDAIAYLEENGYVSAVHILFSTMDMTTYEDLPEEEQAEKKAQAEALVEELQAVEEDTDRFALFLSKMEEVSEDTGKSYYPEGYTYTAGTMVTEFEDAVNALEEYQISEVVKSDYGYHVIMRLPLSADRVVEYSSENEALNARALFANQDYGDQLQAYADTLELVWKDGYSAPDLEPYLYRAAG